VLISDADLSAPIGDSAALLDALEGDTDVAIASRAHPRSDIPIRQPWWREAMGRVFNLLARAGGLTSFRDTQCGLKAVRRSAIVPLLDRCRVNGFAFDVELLYAAASAGLHVREFPVTWRDRPDTRVHPVRAPLAMARDLCRIRMRAWIGRYDGSHRGYHFEWAALAFIVLGLAVRCRGLTQPWVDTWSWRQADVAMIARNFALRGLHLWWPQIDWSGDGAGFVGTEFPALAAVVALAYRWWGIHEYIGRFVVVLTYVIAATMLQILVKKIVSARAAWVSAAAFALMPLSVFASRSFMSDMPALALALTTVVCFQRYLAKPVTARALVTALLLALTLLVKLPAAVVGLPLAYMVVARRGWRGLADTRLGTIAVLGWLPALIWYSHALDIARTYEPYHMFGEGGLGIVSMAAYWERARTLVEDGFTPVAAVIALIGIAAVPKGRDRFLFHWWAAAALLFSVVAGVGSQHPWYQLPLVPAGAALCGSAYEWLTTRVAGTRIRHLCAPLALAIIAVIGAQSYQALRPRYLSWGEPLRQAGLATQQIAPPEALIVAIDEGDPSLIYYSGRRGWHLLRNSGSLPLHSEDAVAELEYFRSRGASYLIVTQYTDWWLTHYEAFGQHVKARYPRIISTGQYAIYQLGQPSDKDAHAR
jgi:4-amino-4-deoxy-L-arabinose transferase-like glycosyltransferase